MTERIKYYEHAAEGGKGLHLLHDYLLDCSIPVTLVDLVYLRISQINGCAYCIDLHSRDLLKNGYPAEKMRLVSVWHEVGELFTEREQAALRWAESLTNVSETHAPDSDYEAVAKVFPPRELADLSLAIALMNAYNRLGIGFRMPPEALVQHRREARRKA